MALADYLNIHGQNQHYYSLLLPFTACYTNIKAGFWILILSISLMRISVDTCTAASFPKGMPELPLVYTYLPATISMTIVTHSPCPAAPQLHDHHQVTIGYWAHGAAKQQHETALNNCVTKTVILHKTGFQNIMQKSISN